MLWRGSIPRDASPPEDLRFVVQSVNGVGLVALSANLGEFFVPNQTAPPVTPPAATVVELIAPPASGTYGQRVTLRARLTSAGAPVPNQTLSFHIGGLQSRSLTGADGIATIQLNLLHEPSSIPLELSARWRGSLTLAAAHASTTFLLSRSPSALSVAPSPASVRPGAPDTLWASLADATGRTLSEQNVLFVVDGPGGTRVVSSTTDFSGRAALGGVDLPAGAYTAVAYFGQTVLPPFPFEPVGSPHPLYDSSTSSATLTIDPGTPTAFDDEFNGQSGKPLKIPVSQIVGNDTDPSNGELELTSVDASTGRGVTVTRSGSWVLLGNLPVDVRSDAFEYEAANAAGKSSRARVVIRLTPDEAPTSNLLAVTPENGGIRIRFAGIPGRTYRIQFSASPPGGWGTLGQTQVGPDGLATFLAPAPVGGAGFYRTAYP